MREAAELVHEKRLAFARGDLLKKKHYKGKVFQVSLANGSCEAKVHIDKIDMWHRKWIGQLVLDSNEFTDELIRKEMTVFTGAQNQTEARHGTAIC